MEKKIGRPTDNPKIDRVTIRVDKQTQEILEQKMKIFGTNKSETLTRNLNTFIIEIDEEESNEYLLKLEEVNENILEVISEGEKFFETIESETNFRIKFELYNKYSKKVSAVIKKRNMTFLDNYLFEAKEKLKQKFKEKGFPFPESITFKMYNLNEILQTSFKIEEKMVELMKQYETVWEKIVK